MPDQDEFVVEGFGEITDPPSFEAILLRIRNAADLKTELILSPAELRVLAERLG